ncbi:hypothetical protein PHLCEN_2v10149 [Hermanssonia centrifuga]|uniref:Uncharacterized protein n=1 Tax=Hermanssonia centrifuga TaxID=98765 RepID=A0A2R6NNQ7_9APHY|nr:hypothetical protein PHLCEN_2v10149 [Hermanssonia centrifuga]
MENTRGKIVKIELLHKPSLSQTLFPSQTRKTRYGGFSIVDQFTGGEERNKISGHMDGQRDRKLMLNRKVFTTYDQATKRHALGVGDKWFD